MAALALVTAACAREATDPGPIRLAVWHHAGTEQELSTLADQVSAFNAAHDEVQVVLRDVPEGDYNDELQVAAAQGTLPDVIEVDGPTIAGYVAQGDLVPLDGLVDADQVADQLPSLAAQNSIGGVLYAVAPFDSGLGIYADRSRLEAAGVRVPTRWQEAWTGAELAAALAALAEQDDDGLVLDVQRSYGTTEWLTYGFAPLVASAGGSLIDPTTYSALGHLDGDATVAALRLVQTWSPYVDPDPEDTAFVERRVPLSLIGHWAYPAYAKALGDDLVVLPLPDLGAGSKTGQGSWAWSVSTHDAARQQAAAAFLDFLMTPDEVLRMANANGAVPGTRTALGQSPLYRDGGPLQLFADQLVASCGTAPPSTGCSAVPRPQTPGYLLLSSQFAQAVAAALDGEDPAERLSAAAALVEQDLQAHDGFR